ncbi:coatomer subunit gamma-2-like [Panonychus citri]|uniref:coatomer subunit gamma-2-like n=1 Tax=Panonychus citri TaxID=50023 RepID=UPI002307296D|nr:coatomer subunit gamma-2-like [Panonychus citri]
MYHKKDKKDDEDLAIAGNVFAKVTKTSALQDARSFNETPVNARKCTLILTKILYLMNQGETFTTQEATDLFFNITKLFQSKDTTLRRLVYIGIKELSKIAENVYVVTSSLTTDMNAKDDLCRPQALRALCHITDGTTFQGIERYMKQAIVDKNPAVASAALVSAYHMAKNIPEGVKRWVNEAQESVNSNNVMVQYHALGLLYHIKKNDRLAVSKFLAKFSQTGLKSPYALIMMLRMAAHLFSQDTTNFQYLKLISKYFDHSSDMVMYEALKLFLKAGCIAPVDTLVAAGLMQLTMPSLRPAGKFEAVRTLNQIAMVKPKDVELCNVELENLITDPNRSIATLAITTLLKTGQEGSVDRLIKQISTFMNEISDEFKIVVITATRKLCQKFPRKHSVMMNFLETMLREDGGSEFKKAIVDTILNIILDNPDAKEAGLAHLCEFIEDCEHADLMIRILHLLGKEGPKTTRPSRYIRYIYNRLILESAPIQAAAVSSLAKFGAQCEGLLPDILVLLRRSLLETDDEVRDRAVFYLGILMTNQKSLYNQFILNPIQVSIVDLEKALLQYVSNPKESPFDIRTVPLATHPQPIEEIIKKPQVNGVKPSADANQNQKLASVETGETRRAKYEELLTFFPELEELKLGPLTKSSQPIELTESETEYVVKCIKHVFKRHIVFQFDCINTLNDQVLENVRVSMQVPEGYRKVCIIECPRLEYDVPGVTYTCVELVAEDVTSYTGTFENLLLKYIVKDCDPDTGKVSDDEVGYDDEYALEDVEVYISDYIQGTIKSNFASAWEELGPNAEVEETFVLLSFKTIGEAITNIVRFMGMAPCDRSDVVPEGKLSHSLYLSGVFHGDDEILARAKLAVTTSASDGVTMKLSIRSNNLDLSNFIVSIIA